MNEKVSSEFKVFQPVRFLGHRKIDDPEYDSVPPLTVDKIYIIQGFDINVATCRTVLVVIDDEGEEAWVDKAQVSSVEEKP